MSKTPELVHFDELEAELDSTLRSMAAAFAIEDPSIKVPKDGGTSDDVAADFSKPYADQFLAKLQELRMGLTEEHEQQIRSHFTAVILEYDTLDTVVTGKVEDQTPVEGVNALISEHRQPIMQLLQELDEGYES